MMRWAKAPVGNIRWCDDRTKRAGPSGRWMELLKTHQSVRSSQKTVPCHHLISGHHKTKLDVRNAAQVLVRSCWELMGDYLCHLHLAYSLSSRP